MAVIEFWRWLNKDTEFGLHPSLASVSGDFSAAEHAYALFMRVVFMVSEVALIGAGFMSIAPFVWLFTTVLAYPTPLDIICALGTPVVLFMALRKAHAVVRTAVFDGIRRRGAARQARDLPRENVALDAASVSGGAPVAVSADVDHGAHEPGRGEEPAPRGR